MRAPTLRAAMLAVLLGGCTDPGPTPPAPPPPALAGITVADPFPQGCVDCHIVLPNGEDHRMNVGIRRFPDHPPLDDHKRIPDDCRTCHEPGSLVGALDRLVHALHFRKPAENHFVGMFQGSCLACHRLDAGTGKMPVKSGARNW